MYKKGKQRKQDNSVCVNCPILTERIDDLQSAIQIKDIQLSELQNYVKRICVHSKAQSSKSLEINDSADSKQKSFVPDMRSIKIDDQDHEVLLNSKLIKMQYAHKV